MNLFAIVVLNNYFKTVLHQYSYFSFHFGLLWFCTVFTNAFLTYVF